MPVSEVQTASGDLTWIIFPSGEQLIKRAGLKHIARQNMGTNICAFVYDTDADLASLLDAYLLMVSQKETTFYVGLRKACSLCHASVITRSSLVTK